MPTTVAQSSGSEGLNKVTYLLTEGKTTAILGPVPAEVKCPAEYLRPGEHPAEHLQRGCRALTLVYAKETKATGEAQSEWGEYTGQLARVIFTAYNPASAKMQETAVAEYAYDKQGRLRAEWDPRIEPALKTTYGYDEEDRLTAVSPPGQQPWLLSYATNGESEPTEVESDQCGQEWCKAYLLERKKQGSRLIRAMRPPASTPLGDGSAPVSTAPPTLSDTKPDPPEHGERGR